MFEQYGKKKRSVNQKQMIPSQNNICIVPRQKEDLATRLENKSPTRQLRNIFSHELMKNKIRDKNSSMNSYLQIIESKKDFS